MRAQADEGMWLFNAPPRELLKTKYDFDATDAWLTHLQQSAVRFNSGGSGSFVSAARAGADESPCRRRRAAQTFVGRSTITFATAFWPRPRPTRCKCLDLELNVLVEIRDVTARVTAAVKPEHEPGRIGKSPPGGDQHHRTGIVGQDANCAATWSRSTTAGCITCIGTKNIPTCGWSLRRSSRSRFLAATPTISNIRATIWTSASFAPTKTASRPRSIHYLKWSADGAAGRRVDLRGRPSGPHRSAEDGRASGIPARRRRFR